MFTINHFLWLGLCAAAIAIGLWLAVKAKLTSKQAARVMAVISIASEISKIMSDMNDSDFGGMVLDPRSLPFHLCSMLIFAVFYLSLAKEGPRRDAVLSFTVPIGLLGGVCAMLIPTNGVNFLKIGPYQCYVYHAGLVWFGLYSLIAKQADLGKKAYVRNMLTLLMLSFLMIYVNGALSAYGTNFMYVRKPPMDGLPILNLDHGWYVYLLTLMALGAVLITLVHFPFMIREKRKPNKQ